MKSKKLKHYKPTRYRRHRAPIDRRILIVAAAAVLMLAGSVALGSYLGSLAEDLPADTDTPIDTTDTSPSYDAYPKLDIRPAGSMPMTADAYTKDSLADKFVMKAAGSLVRSISVVLTDSRGVPSYKSDIYEKAYAAPSGNIDLASLIQKAKKSDIETIAIFSYMSENEAYRDIRAIRESYERAIIAEAYSLGVRELILTDIETTDIDTLYSVVCGIKERAPELRVGIAVPPSACADVMYTARLDDVFDFIALDMTEAFRADIEKYPKGEYSSADEYALSGAVREHYFTLARYPSRVYIRLDEDCSHCSALARSIFEAEEVSSYVIAGVYTKQ